MCIYFAQCGRPERVIKRRIWRILANSRSLWPYSEINVQVIMSVKWRDPGQKWNAKWRGKREWVEKWIVANFFFFFFSSKMNETRGLKNLKIERAGNIGRLADSKICKVWKRRVLVIQNWKIIGEYRFREAGSSRIFL